MTRLLNYYLRRQALMQVLFDLGLLLLAMVSYDLLLTRTAPAALGNAAATHGLSLAACLLVINTASGLYRPMQSLSINQSCARAALALVVALPLAYAIFSLLPAELSNRDSMKWAAVVCAAGVIANRVHAARAGRRPRPHSRLLIYGCDASAQVVADTLRAADPRCEIVGHVRSPNEANPTVPANQILQPVHSLRQCALDLGVDEIVVALTERRGGSMPMRELLDCKVGGVRVSDMSTHYEKVLGQIRLEHVHAGWLIFGDGFHQGLLRTVAKRAFDVVCSLLLLMLALPVLALTALAIALESKGGIFYRQERVARGGATFEVLKFRSMRVDAEKGGQPQWAVPKDARITRVGGFIRRFRIDEFPQLVNVLQGDMSLVGPRPERPFFVDSLTRDVPYYAVRHSVKPGLTGWAQVRYQYGASVADALEKLQYDLYYVKNHSLLLDTVILFETVGVVLSGKGAR